MVLCSCLDEQAVKVSIDVDAMRREVAMREGRARRLRLGWRNRARLYRIRRGYDLALELWKKNRPSRCQGCVEHVWLLGHLAWFTSWGRPCCISMALMGAE